MRIVKFAFVVAVLSLTACAASSERASVEERLAELGLQRAGQDSAAIPRYRINGWTYLNDEHIVITAGVNDRYLLELQRGCFDLRSSFSIAFQTATSRVDRFGRIVYRSRIAGTQTCRILNIVELSRVG